MVATKKGKLIAVCRTHSATMANFRRETWQEYFLARVASASRDGTVKKFALIGSPIAYPPTRSDLIFVIPDDKQAAAEALAIDGGWGAHWPDAESLKAAIRAKADSAATV